MNVEFWVDPACPFCWATARWMVDEVVPNRDVRVTWRPISLKFKNEPGEDSPFYEPVTFTHNLMRVMESARTTEGDDAFFDLYWEAGARIHHDGQRTFDVEDLLTSVGLDTKHAAAFDDESWDAVIRAAMDEGLALVGDDVGTPIIALENSDRNLLACARSGSFAFLRRPARLAWEELIVVAKRYEGIVGNFVCNQIAPIVTPLDHLLLRSGPRDARAFASRAQLFQLDCVFF